MSLPTKILVVLNMILSIVFAVASVTLYAKKIDWFDEAQQAVAKSNDLQKELQTKSEEFNKLQETYNLLREGTTKDLNDYQVRLAEAQTENKRLVSNNNELRESVKDMDSKLGDINVKISDAQKENQRLSAKLEKTTKAEQEAVADLEFAQRTALEATADLKDVETQLTDIQKRNAALLEQNIQMTILIDNLRKTNPEVFEVAQVTDTTTEAISGQVLRVREELDLVILSIGETDKVKPGMEFVISRGSTYIGKVRIRSAEGNYSAAVIDKPLTVKPIRVGDRAETLN